MTLWLSKNPFCPFPTTITFDDWFCLRNKLLALHRNLLLTECNKYVASLGWLISNAWPSSWNKMQMVCTILRMAESAKMLDLSPFLKTLKVALNELLQMVHHHFFAQSSQFTRSPVPRNSPVTESTYYKYWRNCLKDSGAESHERWHDSWSTQTTSQSNLHTKWKIDGKQHIDFLQTFW